MRLLSGRMGGMAFLLLKRSAEGMEWLVFLRDYSMIKEGSVKLILKCHKRGKGYEGGWFDSCGRKEPADGRIS